LKLRLNQLIESGLIIRHGKARGTWYALKHWNVGSRLRV
jgi:hypothetical protein